MWDEFPEVKLFLIWHDLKSPDHSKICLVIIARPVESRLTEKVDFWSVHCNRPASPSNINEKHMQLAKLCVRPLSVSETD